MKKRIFIVQPNGQNDEDTRHDVCTTFSRRTFRDIYIDDAFEVLTSCASLRNALAVAKGYSGQKRIAVI